MHYFTIFTLRMLCFSFVFTNESQAQYVPAYDNNGNSRYSSRFRSEDVKRPEIVNPAGSTQKPSTSQPSSTDRSIEKGSDEKKVYSTKRADANGLYVERSPSNNLYGYHNFITGQEVITHSFTDYKIESEGFYGLKLDKWGFLDKTGNVMIPFRFDEIHVIFTNGIAKVEAAGNIFWIDKNGNEVGDERVKAIQSKGRLERYMDVAPTADENG